MSIREVVNISEKIRFVKKRDIIKTEDHNNFVDLFREVYNYLTNVINFVDKNITYINHLCPEKDFTNYKILYNNTVRINTKYSVQNVNFVHVGFFNYYTFAIEVGYSDSQYVVQFLFSILSNNVTKIISEDESKVPKYYFFRTIYDKYTAWLKGESLSCLKPCLLSFNNNLCADICLNLENLSNSLYSYVVSYDGKYFGVAKYVGHGEYYIDIQFIVIEFY